MGQLPDLLNVSNKVLVLVSQTLCHILSGALTLTRARFFGGLASPPNNLAHTRVGAPDKTLCDPNTPPSWVLTKSFYTDHVT